MRISRDILAFFIGFFIAKFCYEKKEKNNKKEEIQVFVNAIKNKKKLVVTKGNFSEVYNYSDSEKYFYDYVFSDKKGIITINPSIEVGYDLSKLEVQKDSLKKV